MNKTGTLFLLSVFLAAAPAFSESAEDLKTLTTDRVSAERVKAAKRLGMLVNTTSEIIDALGRASISDPAPEVRAESARSLAKKQDDTTFNWLVKSLHANTLESVCHAVAEGLYQTKDYKAFTALKKALYSHKSPECRGVIAEALSYIKTEESVNALRNALAEEKDSSVRGKILSDLAQMKMPEAMPAIGQGLKTDTDKANRMKAAKLLGESGAQNSVQWLVTTMNSDPELEVRKAAIDALVKLNTKDETALSNMKYLSEHDATPEIKELSGKAYQYLSSSQTKSWEAFTSTAPVENTPVLQSASQEVVDHLIDILRTDPDKKIREMTVYELADKEGGKVVSALIYAMDNDEEPMVRKRSVQALAKRPTPEILKAFMDALSKEKNKYVHQALTIAIKTASQNKAAHASKSGTGTNNQ